MSRNGGVPDRPRSVDITAELVSADLGPVELASGPDEAEMSFPALEGFALGEHSISAFSVSDGVLSGDVDLDTSDASFALPCPG